MELRERMEALRALSVEEPSEEGWARLTALFDTWEWSQDLVVGLEYAEGVLAAWPEALRQAPALWVDVLLGAPKGLVRRRWKRGERAHPAMRLVRVLDLQRRRLTPAELKGLALGGPALGAITTLDMGQCGLDDEGALALSRCHDLSHLRVLRLDLNRIGPQGMWDLARSPLLAGLIELNVDNNPLGYEGVRAITQCEGLGDLLALRVVSTAMDDAAFAALAEARHLAGLRCLEVGHMHWGVSNQAFASLGAAPFAPRLHHLGLRSLKLSAEAVAVLAAGRFDNVRTLDLSGVQTDEATLRLLVAVGAFPALEHVIAAWADAAQEKLLGDVFKVQVLRRSSR